MMECHHLNFIFKSGENGQGCRKWVWRARYKQFVHSIWVFLPLDQNIDCSNKLQLKIVHDSTSHYVVLNDRHVISDIVAYLHVHSVDYNSFVNTVVNQLNIENFLDLDAIENVAQPSIVTFDSLYVCNQFCCVINFNLCFQLTPWNHDMWFLSYLLLTMCFLLSMHLALCFHLHVIFVYHSWRRFFPPLFIFHSPCHCW